jgi:hypothetical protein
MLPSKMKIGSADDSRGCQKPFAGQWDPVRTTVVLRELPEARSGRVIFFISKLPCAAFASPLMRKRSAAQW